MQDVIEWAGFAAGVALVGATGGSLIRTLVVPRGLSSRLSAAVVAAMRSIYLRAARQFASYKRRDYILAMQAPVTLLALLAVWLVLFLAGFALILWPLAGKGLLQALRESGSAMFTLGFAAPSETGPTAVTFATAATGLVVVALQIAYLPTLYAAFNRRETLVTMLQSRAGVPAWGPEILARHRLVNTLDNLPDFYAEWERWAADVAESHANYPVLIYFRSPHPLRSWVLALLAVLDSAALYNSLCPATAPSEVRLFIRMGFTCLRDIADAIGLDYDHDPPPEAPIALTRAEFDDAIARLAHVGFAMERTPDEAWPHFHGWRVNYEALAHALADRVAAAPALWAGPRTRVPGDIIPLQRPVDRQPGTGVTEPRRDPEWRV